MPCWSPSWPGSSSRSCPPPPPPRSAARGPPRRKDEPVLAAVIAEGVAIALLGLLVLGLLRSHALIMKALHELGAGLELEDTDEHGTQHKGSGPVPVQLEQDVVGTTLHDEEVSVAVSATGRRTLLAFLSSGCAVCATFWEELSRGHTAVPGAASLLVVAKGP